MSFLIEKGKEAYFTWAQWSVPVIIQEVENDWVLIRYPLDEPIGPGIFVDLQINYNGFSAYYYYFTLNAPRQFNDFLYLRRAGSRSYTERRQSFRVVMNIPVRMEYGHNRIGFEGTLIDLSSNGAYVSVEHKLPITNPIRLYLPISNRTVPIHGVIVRKESERSRSGLPLRFGIRFINTSIEERNMLVYYIWSRIRQQYNFNFAELYPGAGTRRKSREINP